MAVASAADDPEPDPGKTVAEEEDLPPGQRGPARRPSSPSTGVGGIIAAVSSRVDIASSHVELDDILPLDDASTALALPPRGRPRRREGPPLWRARTQLWPGRPDEGLQHLQRDHRGPRRRHLERAELVPLPAVPRSGDEAGLHGEPERRAQGGLGGPQAFQQGAVAPRRHQDQGRQRARRAK